MLHEVLKVEEVREKISSMPEELQSQVTLLQKQIEEVQTVATTNSPSRLQDVRNILQTVNRSLASLALERAFINLGLPSNLPRGFAQTMNIPRSTGGLGIRPQNINFPTHGLAFVSPTTFGEVLLNILPSHTILPAGQVNIVLDTPAAGSNSDSNNAIRFVPQGLFVSANALVPSQLGNMSSLGNAPLGIQISPKGMDFLSLYYKKIALGLHPDKSANWAIWVSEYPVLAQTVTSMFHGNDKKPIDITEDERKQMFTIVAEANKIWKDDDLKALWEKQFELQQEGISLEDAIKQFVPKTSEDQLADFKSNVNYLTDALKLKSIEMQDATSVQDAYALFARHIPDLVANLKRENQINRAAVGAFQKNMSTDGINNLYQRIGIVRKANVMLLQMVPQAMLSGPTKAAIEDATKENPETAEGQQLVEANQKTTAFQKELLRIAQNVFNQGQFVEKLANRMIKKPNIKKIGDVLRQSTENQEQQKLLQAYITAQKIQYAASSSE